MLFKDLETYISEVNSLAENLDCNASPYFHRKLNFVVERGNEIIEQTRKELFEKSDSTNTHVAIEYEYEVTHQLRSPLNGVLGFTKETLLNTELSIQQKEYLEIAYKQAEAALNEVDGILASRKVRDSTKIERVIKFTSENYQAGLSILCYFSEVVKKNYPGDNIEVRIIQEGLAVRLTIVTPEGKTESIEETLEDYGAVICGKKPISTLLTNELDILELKQQLRIASIQLEHKKELLEIEKSHSRSSIERLETIEEKFDGLVNQIFKVIERKDTLQKEINVLSRSLMNKHLKVVADAIKLLENKVAKGIKIEDETNVKNALSTIAKHEADVFEKINNIALGAISSASGNLLYKWLVEITKLLPK